MTSPSGPSVTTCVTPSWRPSAAAWRSPLARRPPRSRASIQSRLRYRITGTVCPVVRRVVSAAVDVIGRGTKVFTSPPVQGVLRVLDVPDRRLALMDDGATA